MAHFIEVYAHRGFSGRFPENTMIAFEEARKMKVAGIELDVQLTKDGEVVVIHDERIDRTTNGIGYVHEFLYKQLCLFDAGSWFHSKYHTEAIPLLSEVFEWRIEKKSDITLNIELKNDQIDYPGLEEKVIRLIEEYDFSDRTIISSFNYDSLVKVRSIHPYVSIGLLFEGIDKEAVEKAKKIQAQGLHCESVYALSNEGKRAQAQGLDLRVYTVNKPEEFLQLKESGVKVIMTDVPHEIYPNLDCNR
ncbi:glycerophosphodiester phosphodiesterase [Priestia megaterium]|nr:glycerophosphodiester phosphodiesterase [Priestia megaterium]